MLLYFFSQCMIQYVEKEVYDDLHGFACTSMTAKDMAVQLHSDILIWLET